MQRVLVTGGAGFIGANIVRLLMREVVDDVVVLDNFSSGHRTNLDGLGIRVIEGDVRDAGAVSEAMRGRDTVFHLAASVGNARSIAHPLEDAQINVLGTLTVLEAARRQGVDKLVYSSSAGIFGELKTLPIAEDHSLDPDSPYGCTKLAGEKLCLSYAKLYPMACVCLRYFNVYGPRQRAGSGGGLVANIVEALGQGRLLADCDERSAEDFLYVDDAVVATLAAGRAPRAAGRIINVGSGKLVSIGDLLVMLGNLLQTSTKARMRLHPESGPHQICARMSLAAELLDFEPRVSLVDGLARLVRFMTESQHVEPHVLAQVGPE